MSKNIETMNNSGRKTSGETGEIGALEALWSLFSSMKTAIVLLLLLAATSVAGTLIQQNAPPEAYKGNYELLRSLGLTDAYHSGWYRLLLALFALNLTVCSINRFRSAWRRTFQPKVSTSREQVASSSRSQEFSCGGPLEEVVGKVTGALRSRSYGVLIDKQANNVSIYATKGRLSIWGPYLTHLSILIIFVGSIVGGLLGVHGRTMIVEGERSGSYMREGAGKDKKAQHETTDLGFSVGLRDFTIEYDKAHHPTAYKSDLQVYDDGKQVARKVIDVNHPLTYKGTSFFQTSYGLVALTLKVTAPNGASKTVQYKVGTMSSPEGGVVYGVPSSDGPLKQVEIGGKKLTVYVHNIAPDYVGGSRVNASDMPINPAVDVMVNERFPEYKGLDAWSRLGWLPLSKSATYNGFTITLDKATDYTLLEVSNNPGLPVVYVGFGLMLVGVFISFYVTRKVVTACVSSSDRGVNVLAGATSRGEPSVFDKDFDRLRDALS